MGVQMKQLQWVMISIFVLALLVGAETVNAYVMHGGGSYYPTRNYYMMDYYSRPYTQGYYYNPYTYSFSGHFYGNYYNDPNWKYYTLDTFSRGHRYGFY